MVTKVLSLPLAYCMVGAQGGIFGTQPFKKKNTFSTEFCDGICTTYVCTIIKEHESDKNQNVVPFQNGGQITNL